MGSFKRALLGYRRDEVEAAVEARDARLGILERAVEESGERVRAGAEALTRAEADLASLAEMVIEREREIRALGERLREANDRHDRSIDSLASTASRLEEIQAQARGQATRIRMKALRDAVAAREGDGAAAESLFEGLVKLEIGPLGDFSQLVGIEEAIGTIGGSEISVERFSEGRATLSMRLEEPVDLLRELEERAPQEFRVRRSSADNVVIDLDEGHGPEQRAA